MESYTSYDDYSTSVPHPSIINIIIADIRMSPPPAAGNIRVPTHTAKSMPENTTPKTVTAAQEVTEPTSGTIKHPTTVVSAILNSTTTTALKGLGAKDQPATTSEQSSLPDVVQTKAANLLSNTSSPAQTDRAAISNPSQKQAVGLYAPSLNKISANNSTSQLKVPFISVKSVLRIL